MKIILYSFILKIYINQRLNHLFNNKIYGDYFLEYEWMEYWLNIKFSKLINRSYRDLRRIMEEYN
jgi:hypothetical protein